MEPRGPSLSPASTLDFVRVGTGGSGRNRGREPWRVRGDSKEEESVKLETARTGSHARSLIKGRGQPPCFGINSKHITGMWTHLRPTATEAENEAH